jgi:hypothetical protein
MDEKNDDMAMRDYFSMSGNKEASIKNESAFPVQSMTQAAYGMTLRDYFAGQVIAVAYKDFWDDVKAVQQVSYDGWELAIASDAYRMADAMLRARDEQ